MYGFSVDFHCVCQFVPGMGSRNTVPLIRLLILALKYIHVSRLLVYFVCLPTYPFIHFSLLIFDVDNR